MAVHDAGDDVGEIATGLSSGELAGLGQRVDHRPVFSNSGSPITIDTMLATPARRRTLTYGS